MPTITPTSSQNQRPERLGGCGASERVVRVREGHQRGDPLKPLGHVLTRNEQPAEQDLRKDERGHELHRLELGARERTEEQSERHAEDRVRDRQPDHQQLRVARLEPQQPEADDGHDRRLDGCDRSEREAVADEEVELRDREREQPLEGSSSSFTQHRDRGDEEHGDEREETEQRDSHLLERLWLIGEDLVDQDHQHARDDQEQRDRPRISPELGEYARCSRTRRAEAHVSLSSTSRRKASSRSAAPVRCSSSSGVRAARISPSRSRTRRSQRAASSMTWLDTSSVVPA